MTDWTDFGGDERATRRARADRDATDWMIRLQDAPEDRGLKARFDAWLDADPENEAAWEETIGVLDAIGAAQPAHQAYWADHAAAKAVSSSAATPLGRPTARGAIRRWGRQAALMGVAACLAIAAAPEIALRLQADHVTPIGQARQVRLADGSTVQLAPDSAISVAYSGGQRGVRLLKGDAYFEVQPDHARPFQVSAGEVRTTVLGTGFEVRRRPAETDVAVRHGRVRVDRDTGGVPVSVRLSAGDRVAISSDGATKDRIRPDRVATWTEGRLVVSEVPVGEVVAALRPWYAGVVLTTGKGVDEARVTGVYDLDQPVAALAAVAQAHDLQVRRISPWMVVISAR